MFPAKENRKSFTKVQREKEFTEITDGQTYTSDNRNINRMSWREYHVTRNLEDITWPRAGQLVRRSTIGIALGQFGAIGGGRGVAFVQRSRRKSNRWQEKRERKSERTESVLTLTFGKYPCSYESGACTGGWNCSDFDRENFFRCWRGFKKGGVQMMLKQIHQDWSFQEWFVDRWEKGNM
jgi:hypothetical protein